MATTKVRYNQIKTGLPAGGDVNYNNVKLLLKGEGTDGSTSFQDSSIVENSISHQSTTTISTSDYKFGSSSISFQGSTSALYFPKNDDVAISTEDFTLETWYKPTAYNHKYSPILSLGNAWSNISNGLFNYLLYYYPNDNKLGFLSKHGTTSYRTAIATATLNLNTWYHIAATRTNNTLYLFLDGTLISADTTESWSSVDLDFTIPANNNFYVGLISQGNYINDALYSFRGYMDNIRITKGVARYTSNFSVPTAAFPAFESKEGKKMVVGSNGNIDLQ